VHRAKAETDGVLYFCYEDILIRPPLLSSKRLSLLDIDAEDAGRITFYLALAGSSHSVPYLDS